MADDVGKLVRHRGTGECGTAFPAFRDAHVHLGLVAYDDLAAGGLGGVVDLGWSPDIADLAAGAPVHVAYAGCFLTAPGGYPSDRSWAPEDCVRPVSGPADAAVAVAEQVGRGASVVKVTLHCDAGPVLDKTTLTAIVAAAEVPVVAHVEGPGMTGRALAAGVGVLAHTPWTERLDDDLIDRAAASQRWISTLAIHDGTSAQEVAVDNLRRFHRAGGEVLYGTDLGNGDLPVGVNRREVELLQRAGLRNRAVIHALTAPFPVPLGTDLRTFVPAIPDHDLAAWLAQAVVVRPEELVEAQGDGPVHGA
ncbi:hypothetical protein ncot_05470 [Nocardioides sp. JQ2195]|uniref:hypothetical protein n=1 Tax=Nocardioides sp. JQ2195 TaxID=2592334 RepID=UPI00143E6487|nr:hypothetical protein [Nocardioides sp. JQ2195]QIX26109.1 hypothetical protein ncot_05470 [Nocardioides sp. JQ2195]